MIDALNHKKSTDTRADADAQSRKLRRTSAKGNCVTGLICSVDMPLACMAQSILARPSALQDATNYLATSQYGQWAKAQFIPKNRRTVRQQHQAHGAAQS